MNGGEEGKSQELVIIRRRGGEGDDKHHGGVWKIAYADFMTAMMAFFLVMWLINSTDKKTLTQVATYFNPMRLTDKRPTPKGLQEPDGSEGKDAVTQKGGKKKDKGEGKGTKKAEELESGEIRPHGKPFDRKIEDVDKKVPEAHGATAGESPRQAGGRAFRDPFDSVRRTEIVPTDPAMARAEPVSPRAGPASAGDARRQGAVEAKSADSPEQRFPAGRDTKEGEPSGVAPPAGATQMKRADLAPPAPASIGEGKRADPTGPSPATAGEADRAEQVEPRKAGAGDAKRGEYALPPPSSGNVEARRAASAEVLPDLPGETKRGEQMPPASGNLEAGRIASSEAPPLPSGEAKRVEPPPLPSSPGAIEAKPAAGRDGAQAASGEAKAAALAAERAAVAERVAAERADAENLEGTIRRALAEALPGILPHVDVTVTSEGVLISLTDDFDFGMFAIGSAEPRPATHVVMDKVGKILQTRTETLIVRGHTDSRKYRTAAYDNWRLSTARAHVAYTMLARSGVDESRFERIEGHADRVPRVPSDTEAAQNRRIEILLRKPQP